MTKAARLTTLKLLLDNSNKLLGNFISKNTLEVSDEELYQFIKKTKGSIDKGLFLVPDHSINELKRDPAFEESETENYLDQIQLINLSIFTFNVLKEQEYETCINNFFRSIAYDNEATQEEVEFYVKLRHKALVTHCEEKRITNISEKFNEFFPQDVDKFYFSPNYGNNYEVTASVDYYRKKLQKESKEEILNGPTFLSDDSLEAFVRNRYENLAPKLQVTLKRKSVENPKQTKKARITYIATTEVSASEKAEAAKLINQKPKGRKLPGQAVIENDPTLIFDSEEELEPRSDPDEEITVVRDSDNDEVEDRHYLDKETDEIDQLCDEFSDDEMNKAVEPDQRSTLSNNNTHNAPNNADSESFIRVRRKVRKPSTPWTNEEVTALKNGLKHFRRPYWANIIRYTTPALDNRTGPQLKDKARTMIGELKRKGYTEPDQFGPYKYVHHPDTSEEYDIVKIRI